MAPPGIDEYVKERLWPARLRFIFDSSLLPPLTIGIVLVIAYLRYSARLNVFGIAVSGYWFELLKGSVGTVVLLLIEKFVLKVPISKAWYAVTLMGFLFFGCFQAWEKEYTSRIGRETDLIKANARADYAYREGYRKGKADQVEYKSRTAISRESSSTNSPLTPAQVKDMGLAVAVELEDLLESTEFMWNSTEETIKRDPSSGPMLAHRFDDVRHQIREKWITGLHDRAEKVRVELAKRGLRDSMLDVWLSATGVTMPDTPIQIRQMDTVLRRILDKL